MDERQTIVGGATTPWWRGASFTLPTSLTSRGIGSLIVWEAGLLLGYVVLRSVHAADPLLVAWAVLAIITAVVSPISGLVVVAALVPFTEAVTADGRVTVAPVLVGALLVSAALRLPRWLRALRGCDRQPRIWAGAVALLLVGTAASIATTYLTFGPARAMDAALVWATGIGGGLLVALVAGGISMTGQSRGLVVVVGSTALAAILALVDQLAGHSLATGVLDWALRPDLGDVRLTGVNPAPNPAATLYLLPAAVLAALALPGLGDRVDPPLRRSLALRVLAVVAALAVMVAVVLTYSRSGLVALALVGVLLAWRIHRAAGLAAVIVGTAAVGLLAATVLDVRQAGLGGGLAELLTVGDSHRVSAWSVAVRMWLDEPLTGQGFGTFDLVRGVFGGTAATAPHQEWLRFFAEGGIVVGLAGILFVVATLVVLRRARSPLGTGLFGAFIAFVVMAAFNNPLLYLQVSLPVLVAAGGAVGMVARHRTLGLPSDMTEPSVDADAAPMATPAAGRTTRSGPSPAMATVLSALWPGLGQAYEGQRRTALLHALPPAIAIIAVAAYLGNRGAESAAALLIQPTVALAVLAVVIAVGVWRLASMAHAHAHARAVARRAGATGAGRAGLATSVLAVFIVVALHAYAGSFPWAFYQAGQAIFRPEPGPAAPDPAVTPEPGTTADPSLIPTDPPTTGMVNVLFIGIDASPQRVGEQRLTDTMILASFDPAEGRVEMVSLPRDIALFPLYHQPDQEFDGKINELMAWVEDHPSGSPDDPLRTLIREIEYLIGIGIDYYATIEIPGLRLMIDAVGGIDIVNEELIDDPTYQLDVDRIGFRLEPGPHHLDGEMALAYVRSRKGVGNNDFERARRQQQLILALRQKLDDPSVLARLPDILGVARETIRTDLPSDRLPQLMELARQSEGARVKSVVLGPSLYASQIPPDEFHGLYGLRLDLDAVADLSRRLWGSQSRYWALPDVPPINGPAD